MKSIYDSRFIYILVAFALTFAFSSTTQAQNLTCTEGDSPYEVGNTLSIEAWTFIEGGSPEEERYSFDPFTFINGHTYTYPFEEFITFDVYDLVTMESCVTTIEVNSNCDLLNTSDYTTEESPITKPLFISEIVDPHCPLAKPQFIHPITGIADNILDISTIPIGSYNVKVTNIFGATSSFILDVVTAGTCAISTCLDLTLGQSNQPYFVDATDLIPNACSDLYQIRALGSSIFKERETVNRSIADTYIFELFHPNSGTTCQSSITITPCDQVVVDCVDSLRIFFSSQADSIEIGPWDIFESYCDQENLRYAYLGDTVQNVIISSSEIGNSFMVDIIREDNTVGCIFPISVETLEGGNCNNLVIDDNRPILDPSQGNVLHPENFLINPCPENNYQIGLSFTEYSDSLIIDWSTAPNPLITYIQAEGALYPVSIPIQWDDNCEDQPLCKDTIIVSPPNSNIHIPVRSLYSNNLCSYLEVNSNFECIISDTLDLSNQVSGIYEVRIEADQRRYCTSNITLYKDCGFTCFNDFDIPLAQGESYTFLNAGVFVNDPCFVENQACGSDVYLFNYNGSRINGFDINYIADGGQDSVYIYNSFTLDSCLMYINIIDDGCQSITCKDTTILLDASGTITLFPEDLVSESCPEHSLEMQQIFPFIMGQTQDSIVVDIINGHDQTIKVIDEDIEAGRPNQCDSKITLIDVDCQNAFICKDSLHFTLDVSQNLVFLNTEDLMDSSCSLLDLAIIVDGIEESSLEINNTWQNQEVQVISRVMDDTCSVYISMEDQLNCNDTLQCLSYLDIEIVDTVVLVNAEIFILNFCADRTYRMEDENGVVIPPTFYDNQIRDTIFAFVVDELTGFRCPISFTTNKVFDCELSCKDHEIEWNGLGNQLLTFTLSDVLDSLCAGQYVISGTGVAPGPDSLYFFNTSFPTPTDITISNLNSGQGCASTITLVQFNSFIEGHVFIDEAQNCLLDESQDTIPLSNVSVAIVNGMDTSYVTTDWDGKYRISVPEGNYDVYALSRNPSRWDYCAGIINVNVLDGQTSEVDLVLNPVDDCYYPEVSLSGSFLRRCFETWVSIRYVNDGASLMPGTEIELTLDTFISVVEASHPYSISTDNTVIFSLGDLQAGEGGLIRVKVFTECSDDIVLGQTQCLSVEMTPSSDCTSVDNYSGPDLDVFGFCDMDSVRFRIQNNGNLDMQIPYEFIVIEDEILRTRNAVQLNVQEEVNLAYESTGGTFTLISNQVVEYPFSRQISTFVEACENGTSPMISIGFANMFPLNDEDPNVDIECFEIRGSFDPNDKNGSPTGISAKRNIDEGLAIEYTIRFENIGNDTAFVVRVEDYIDPSLDLSSLEVIGASAEFNLEVEDRNIIFTLPNANLTPVKQDSLGAQGYIKFSILPFENVPKFTEVYNQAEIYFDFNAPIITNTTLHTIGLDFNVSSTYPLQTVEAVQMAPNPANQYADIQFPDDDLLMVWKVYNLEGTYIDQGSDSRINTDKWSNGIYLLVIEGEKKTYRAKLAVVK